MKILVVSDSHFFNDNLQRITQRYKNKVDLMIHCGDSSLPLHAPLLKPFDIVVKGNHDEADFPRFVNKYHICITHGQYYHVYAGYDELVQLCKQQKCHICFHGHTHVPTHQVHQNIHFINPGSIMMNRGSYGYGTYAIVTVEDNFIHVDFYHYKTDELCNQSILEEGYELLEEFKKMI